MVHVKVEEMPLLLILNIQN